MPRSRELDSRRARLTPEQRARFEGLLAGRAQRRPAQGAAIPRRAGTGPVPASHAQQRLWFLEQIVPDSTAYNLPNALRLEGALDVAAIERALQEVVRRHESLRTGFEVLDGQPVQRVFPDFVPSLDVSDLEGTPDPEGEVRRRAEEDARTHFDLRGPSLLRTRLLRLSPRDHVLLLTLHHLVADTWSFGVLLGELSRLYAAFRAGERSPLPELPVQYADFSEWQRGFLRGEALEAQLAHWRAALGDDVAPLELPLDRPRPPVQSFRGRTLPLTFPRALSAQVKAGARRQGATPFMVLMAAFTALLGRYSGQAQVLVGTPIAGRRHTDLEGLIGLFANTLVLRTDLRGDPPFGALVQRVRDTALQAYSHPDVPFERLVEALQPRRDLSRNPLFQVMLAVQNTPMQSLSLGDLTVTPVPFDDRSAKFDLWLSLVDADERLTGVVQYCSDLFEESSVERLMRHLQVLLEAGLAQPERPLSHLAMQWPEDERVVLRDWNRSAAPFPSQAGLHALCAQQARRTPRAPAVVFAGETLTQAELHARAARLARHLRARGVGPETRVAVLLERSLDLVVALLAVLKAGAAYVPLDPAYPRERLRGMVEDALPRALLTQQALASICAALPETGLERLVLDDPGTAAEIAGQAPDELDDATSPDSLAYVIFTSGSTGRPKGAMLHHRGVVNRLCWMQSAYALAPGERVLQKTPFSFDVSVWEFFWPLMTGATLVVARPGGHQDPAYLLDVIEREQITTLHFVPSLLRVFLDQDPRELARCRSLRRVFASGEALPLDVHEQFFERLPGVELHNLYGPTEASVDVTFWRCRPGHAGRSVPIGRPVANTQVYVLDRHLAPAAAGVPGELYLGGVQVGRGYIRRPDLTAERFVPDPFGEAGARLYRTGDRVRFLADGALEFLGRLDDQVKLRGLRIELGEIEAALRRQPEVREAAAAVFEAAADDRRLAAYVVCAPDDAALASRTHEQVAHWEQVFETAYGAERSAHAPELDLSGWTSSYTGAPLPAEEMQTWVDSSVARIAALQPARVLELGCGTGLLLLRLAGACELYLGTDLARGALARLEDVVRARGLSDVVRLEARAAHDLDALAAHGFDTVVLNSVVQYFPGPEYLLDVLAGVLRVLRPGGRIFVGDVRSLPLLEAFHASLALHRAADQTPLDLVRREADARRQQDDELVLAPELFLDLPRRFPQIGGVELHLKRGRFRNELSCFRYDVVLSLGPAPPAGEVEWRRFDDAPRGAEALLAQALAARGSFGLRDVPDPRPAAALGAQAALGGGLAAGDAAAARAFAERHARAQAGLEPEDVWEAAERAGREARLSPARTPGRYDVLFLAPGATAPAWPWTPPSERPLEEWATSPVRQRFARALAPELRRRLQAELPDYMVPAAFVRLDRLPLTPSGKLDRHALPPPPPAPVETDAPPRTPAEQILAEAWADVLGLPRVSIHANFFELGGDSIHAIQVVARARRAGLRLHPRQVFQAPTIAELALGAEALSRDDATEGGHERAALTPAQRALLAAPALPPAEVRCLHTPEPLDSDALAQALMALATRHAALRLHVERADDGGCQRVAPAPAPPATFLEDALDLSALDGEPLARALRDASEHLAQAVAAPGGPLWRVRSLRLGSGGALLWAAHPLALDARSWELLARELPGEYARAQGGTPARVAGEPSPYAAWARDASAPETHAPRPRLDEARAHERASLTADEARAVYRAAALGRARLDELLAAALARALTSLGAPASLGLELERDARVDHAALRACPGPFTLARRLRLTLAGAAEPEDALRAVKRAAADDGTLPAAVLRVSIASGSHQAAWPLAPRRLPAGVALEIVAETDSDQLDLEWHAGGGAPWNVQDLAHAHVDALRTLAQRVERRPAAAFVPADFPLARLDEAQLAALVARCPDLADAYPLTPMQRHMLSARLERPEAGLYVIHQVMPFEHRGFDAELFRQAWQTMAKRHQPLHTSFVWEGLPEPLQVVRRDAVLRVETVDLRGLDQAAQDAHVDAFVVAQRRAGFALDQAPQSQVCVFRLGASSYKLYWAFNYMLQDGWSFPLAFGEALARYDALAQGLALDETPARPHAEFLALLAARAPEPTREYWSRSLQGVDAPTRFPRSARPPAAHAPDFVKLEGELGPAALTALRACARTHQLTLNTLVQGAWAAVLSAHSGRREVLFGAIASGRPSELPEVEQRVGFFNHMVAVRVDVDPEAALLPWLRALQARQAEVRQHEYVTEAELRAWAGLPAGRNLFDSYLVFENFPMSDDFIRRADRWKFGNVTALAQTEHALRVEILPVGALWLGLGYRPRDFEAEGVAAILADFQATLRRLAGSLSARVAAILPEVRR